MTPAGEGLPGSTPNASAPRPRNRTVLRWTVAALLAAACAGGWLGWRAWVRHEEPAPPDVPLAGVERPVAALIEGALQKVRQQPRSAAAWGFLGKALLAHSFQEQALVCLARAEKLDPQDPRWPYLQGMALLAEQPDRALPHLRRAVQLGERHDPGRTTPRLQLAEVLLAQGLYPEAEEQLRAVARQEPGNLRLRYNLGLLACARQDWKSAAGALAPLTTVPSVRQKAAACLAQVYQRLEERARAAEYGRLAQQMPRDEPWPDDYVREYMDLITVRVARLARVQALDDPEQLRAAVPMLEQLAGAAEEGDSATRLILATTLARLGKYREAAEKLHDVLRLEPENVRGHYVLGLVRFDEGKQILRDTAERAPAEACFRASAASLRRALKLKPDHASAHFQLGRTLLELGQRRAAVAAFRQAALCRPEWAAAHLHLGEALAQDGQDQEALRELKWAVKCATPGDGQPRKALERFRARRKTTD
jgi:tetratricopeptide (TPR) repeat protein